MEAKDIVRKGIMKGNFVLASGRRSSYYIDIKKISLTTDGVEILGRALFDVIRREFPDVVNVGGMELGAVPLVVAVLSAARGKNIKGFIIRKTKKEHGTTRWIEGEPVKGGKTVIIEDVVTTGVTSKEAIEHAREEGLEVVGIAAVVDREERTENFDVKYIPLFKVSELL